MFVKDCEVQMERGGAESIKCDESMSILRVCVAVMQEEYKFLYWVKFQLC